MTNDELAEARRRAMYWIEPGYCEPVTRETAINEEHLALDVIALLSHFRIWVPVGAEPRLLELACIDKLTPPARVQVGMDVTPDDGRRPLFAANAGRVR